MPDGTIMRYDDRFLPEKPGPGAAYAGLAGQGVGLLGGLGTLYAAKKMGILGGGGAAADLATSSGAAENLTTLGSGGLETFGSEMDPVSSAISGAGEGTSFFTGNGLLGEGAVGVGDYIPGVAGLLGVYDLARRQQNYSRGRGALQSGLSGAGIGWTVGGPVGAGVGALAGAIGGGLLGGRKSTKDREKERWQSVGKDPVYKDYFEGTAGQQNRDESNLTAEAITETPDFYRVAGYQNFTPEQKKKAAQAMLDARALNEKQGGIYLNDAYAQQVIDAIKAGEEVPEYKDKAWY